MAETRIPTRKPGYRLETVDSEVLLFHSTRGTIMKCNETAALIWQLIDGKRTTPELIKMVTQAYPEDAAAIPLEFESVLLAFVQHAAVEYK